MKLNDKLKLAGVGAAALAGAVLGLASERVYAVTATALVEARVLMTMTIATLRGLSFGVVSAESVAGVITIDPSGTVSASGGVKAADSGNAGAASFQLVGQPNAAFTIQLPAAALLTDTSGNTMTVKDFKSVPSVTGQLDGNGSLVLNVGGSLEVGASQAPGDYSGQMNVSVNYN